MGSIVSLSAGVDRTSSWRKCDCPTWGLLDRVDRDRLLAGLMEWAWLFHLVRIKLLVHAEHVGVHELRYVRPGRGEARRVMSELCLFADCSRVVLELTPSGQGGADQARLRDFYVSLGFQPNSEPGSGFVWRGELIRHPVKGRWHGSI
jgi:hypothetical protein